MVGLFACRGCGTGVGSKKTKKLFEVGKIKLLREIHLLFNCFLI